MGVPTPAKPPPAFKVGFLLIIHFMSLFISCHKQLFQHKRLTSEQLSILHELCEIHS